MGDRVSIQFVNGKEKSVVLFSHWGGMDFVKTAKAYTKDLHKWIDRQDNCAITPLMRLEPDTVIVDFIRHITKNDVRVDSDLYLAEDENMGDNSDNGHHVINLKEK